MDIVYAADEKYAPFLSVSAESLVLNHEGREPLRIFVLSNGIGRVSSEKLTGIGGGGIVTVIDTGDFGEALEKLAGGKVGTARFSAATYIRLFASKFLPEDVERFVYLDSDTVVMGSLSGLYEADLHGFPAGMVMEPTIYPELRKKLGLGLDEPYMNAGVIVFDRFDWDRGNYLDLCTDFLRKENGKLDFLDQDILNVCLKGRIAAVSPKYNFFSNYYYRTYESLVKLAPPYGETVTKEEFEEAKKHPALIHFAGDERPWYRGNRNPYRSEFEKYLSLSPFAGLQKEKGHEVYMALYHAVNLLTGVFPEARDFLSECYFAGRGKDM